MAEEYRVHFLVQDDQVPGGPTFMTNVWSEGRSKEEIDFVDAPEEQQSAMKAASDAVPLQDRDDYEGWPVVILVPIAGGGYWMREIIPAT